MTIFFIGIKKVEKAGLYQMLYNTNIDLRQTRFLIINNNYLDDCRPFFDIEYDGFSNVFTGQTLKLSSGSHTIKLAIADREDNLL